MLGHWLIRRTAEGFCGGPIVETEAYLQDDPASHGFAGETARNRAMYGPPGRAYVYFIYGNHFCVNAVCRRAGLAEAVLIRAVEAQFGLDILRRNRPGRADLQLTNGPGKLCAALDIRRELDGADLCDAASPLLLARHPGGAFRQSRGPVVHPTDRHRQGGGFAAPFFPGTKPQCLAPDRRKIAIERVAMTHSHP